MEHHHPADLFASIQNREIDSRKVVEFSLPGTAERRLPGRRERQGQKSNQKYRSSHRFAPLYYFTCPASAVVPSIPPRPIVSTADDGTITIEPFSLMASY